MATIDVLGEEITHADEARAIARTYEDVFEHDRASGLDANVSVKLTALGLKLGYDLCRENLEHVVAAAARDGNFVRIDMEDSSTTDDTLRLYRELREAGHDNVGIVLQACLRRTHDDIRASPTSAERPALQGHLRRAAGDRLPGLPGGPGDFVPALDPLLDAGAYVGIATHDDWLVAEAQRVADGAALGRGRVRVPDAARRAAGAGRPLVKEGHRLRIYVPFGRHWYAYSMRRLQENPQLAGLHRVRHARAAHSRPSGERPLALGEQREAAVDDERLAADHVRVRASRGTRPRRPCRSGATMRPAGVRERAISSICSRFGKCSSAPVSTTPPETALTRIPRGASSTAR